VSRKRLVRIVGLALVAVSLIFLLRELERQGEALSPSALSPALLWTAALGAVGYGGACILLAGAWHQLVGLFSDQPVPRRVSVWIYAQTQVGKYLPGNVMHLAGRHVLAREQGVAHAALALAALGELAGLASAAGTLALVGWLAGTWGAEEAGAGRVWQAALAVAAVAAGILMVQQLLPALRRRYPGLAPRDARQFRAGALRVYSRYLLFFLICGAIFAALVAADEGALEPRVLGSVVLVFAIAWLAGFLTPGAPSGIGIREAVIVLGLQHLGVSTSGMAVAVLMRAATILGDLFFLAGAALLKPSAAVGPGTPPDCGKDRRC
jgi:uncharacterized membrane protein YbhN (UPF0104 family)